MNFGYPGCGNVAGECKLQISEMNKRIHASVGNVYNIKRKKPAEFAKSLSTKKQQDRF